MTRSMRFACSFFACLEYIFAPLVFVNPLYWPTLRNDAACGTPLHLSASECIIVSRDELRFLDKHILF